MKRELWRPIEGFEKLYEVSNQGRVRSYVVCKSPRLLKPYTDQRGYQQMVFTVNNKQYSFWLHRLVAHAFCKNPNNHNQVNHKNGNKSDNRSSNLEWVTGSDNLKHAWREGLLQRRDVRGEECRCSHLTRDDVLAIRREYVPRLVSQSYLATKYGVSKTAIRQILKRRTWTHI